MGNLWLKIKIWTKVLLIAAAFVYVVLFTYKNSAEKAHFWYWPHHQPETTLLLLVLCAFAAGVVGSFLVRTTFRTMRQIQDMQSRARVQRVDRAIADMHAKAAMLRSKPDAQPAPAPTPTPTPTPAVEPDVRT